MADLDQFRTETRAWLEANCPPEMRKPMRSEKDACWGGRNFDLPVATRSGSGWRRWRSAAGPCPTGRRTMAAAACRRPRPRSSSEEMARDRRALAADQLRHFDARAGAAQVRQRGAEEALPARDRARRNPLVPGLFRAGRRVATSPGCRPRPRTRATTGWSTARRCGPATPTRPTGSSAWSAPRPSRSTSGISFLLFDMASPGVSTKPILLISRQFALLRDLLRRREGAQGPGRRRGQQAAGTSPNICSATSAR